MKQIKETYEPIDAALREMLGRHIAKRDYIRIHYFNQYHEYISTTAIIKSIFEKESAEFLELTTGEEVRLDWIVRLDGKPVSGYQIDDFTCDC